LVPIPAIGQPAPGSGKCHAHLGPTAGRPPELDLGGQRLDHGEPKLQAFLIRHLSYPRSRLEVSVQLFCSRRTRGRPIWSRRLVSRLDADPHVPHHDRDVPLGGQANVDLERTLGSFVSVQHRVVACLCDGRPDVIKLLGIEVNRLGDASEHRTYERDVLGTVAQLQADDAPACVS
jgi:hypothetical protein